MKKFLLFAIGFFLLPSLYAQSDSVTIVPATILQQFEVQAVDKVVLLKWSLEETEEFKSFDIERAENNGDFMKVGSKLAISKSSSGEYDFVDATPKKNTVLRYRLKFLSKDGFVYYSAFKEAKLAEVQWTVRLKQNPVQNNIELEVEAQKAKQAQVAVISHTGQQVLTQTVRLAAGKNNFSLSTQGMLPGIYQLLVEAEGERKSISLIKE